ncbi:hypothetical protein C8024_12185 [Sphingopyxis sp. BSNA05]|nr:hypothetical protein [Sphingopyxis sp. BSNA05]
MTGYYCRLHLEWGSSNCAIFGQMEQGQQRLELKRISARLQLGRLRIVRISSAIPTKQTL